MENFKTIIIGGGAAGLFFAATVNTDGGVLLIERQDRLGKKLSATGNGQGNLTNLQARTTPYFSVSGDDGLAKTLVERYDENAFRQFICKVGGATVADERGRVYPASRQASSVTDLLRYAVSTRGVKVELNAFVDRIEKKSDGFIVSVGDKRYFSKTVLLCTGGKAAKNFGTDGAGYALAKAFGHTVTPLYPSLVQLKTDVTHTKTLKGIRVNDGGLTAVTADGARYNLRGDVIFTDYGVSGDAVFRISAFIADKISSGVRLTVDFLPDITEQEIFDTLQTKRAAFPDLAETELLFGIVNNQIGRAVMKRAKGNLRDAARFVKAFDLTATGSLGFDYAQVTKGGIPLAEVTGDLESRFAKDLYFTGEILDVDGQCGGFNLQWAYSSAMRVARALEKV
jgi:predicted Rossmann fold flavoprotein